MYKITIEKSVPNKNYDEEIKAYNSQYTKYTWMNTPPQEYYFTSCLITELEDNEWESVKKAIITVK